jgi:hypothetical protein
MFTRIFRGAAVVSLLASVGINLGCDKSPTGPTPSAAPIVAPSATPASAGLNVTSVTPSAGPIGGVDDIRVAGTGFQSGATVTLDGVAAKVTRVTSTTISATTPVHMPGTVDVVVTNPDGKSLTLTGGYTFKVMVATLIASPNLVASGGQLTMSWVTPDGRGCIGGGDWIALYRVGDPDDTGAVNGHSDLWYDHLCGATSGTRTLSAPPQPGQYEFRYLIGGAGSVARSNPVTVSG